MRIFLEQVDLQNLKKKKKYGDHLKIGSEG